MNKNGLQTQAVDKDSVELLTDPLLNKGTAFSEEERDAFTLHGLCPRTRVAWTSSWTGASTLYAI